MYPIQIERYAHLPMYGFKMREREEEQRKPTRIVHLINSIYDTHTLVHLA